MVRNQTGILVGFLVLAIVTLFLSILAGVEKPPEGK
jgi:hypothetical protein